MTAFIQSMIGFLDVLVNPYIMPSYKQHCRIAETTKENEGSEAAEKWIKKEMNAHLNKLDGNTPNRALFTKALALEIDLLFHHALDVDFAQGFFQSHFPLLKNKFSNKRCEVFPCPF